MENGETNLENRVAELGLNDSNSRDGLFQVMKAVEAAEATIKYQADESNRLRAALERTTKELEKLKSGDLKAQQLNPFNHYSNSSPVPPLDNDGVFSIDNKVASSITTLDKPSGNESDKAFSLHKDLGARLTMQGHTELHSDRSNGLMDVLAGGQVAIDNIGFPEDLSPSKTAFITRGYHFEGESNPQLNLPGQGQISVAEVNNSRSLKQDLALKIREHEEEILRLRKHLSEYSIKETQIRNEKYVLEKRIAYMRMAFDQQQQDLVDAASKAISYRQDIIEENIRLTYALQAAQQERSMFISSLMPLLAEYAFQPHVADAQTIISHVKVLFRHMQEKLLVTEAKLKESQYQMAPWRSDVNTSVFSPSPAHSSGIKNGLELVPQPPYVDGKVPRYIDPHTTSDWDLSGHSQRVLVGIAKNAESDDLGRYSPLASRDTSDQELAVHPDSISDSVPAHQKDDTSVRQVTFKDHDSNDIDMEESDAEVQQDDREKPANWTSKSSTYATNIEDPSTSYSPYLPPVLEEPSSSFSEAGDDDPLPAIEGLQISGEAFPGRELQACGYSINGTTSCNFEWVRHLDDGSFNYIDGAKQPLYLVTADDVNTYLAIEVQPLDNRNRKGELVKVFANEHGKITCDPEMQNFIERTHYSGHDSYKVSLLVGGDHLAIWEPASLSIKKDSYSIKCSGPSVVSEKFSASTIVLIPYGSPTQFSIVDRQGTVHRLRAETNPDDVSSFRDTIVLVLRFFVSKVIEKKKGKKRGLFFNK